MQKTLKISEKLAVILAQKHYNYNIHAKYIAFCNVCKNITKENIRI